MKKFFTLLVFSLIIQTFNTATAQDLDTITIYGRVVDQNSAVIPGAEIQAVLLKTGASRKTVTDAQGLYRLIQLEPGTYLVRAFIAGFAGQEIPDLVTTSGQSNRLDFMLMPASLSVETVVIPIESSFADESKRTVIGATLPNSQTALLPLPTRSIFDLVFTLPGVTEEPLSTRDLAEDRNVNHASTPEEAGTFALSGSPAYSNNLTIDGLDNNDDRAATERFQPSLEAVEEVQVITNQFSAEYGRASGGRINVRTRGGSQTFHGRAFYNFRDEALSANTFRNKSVGLARLPLQEHVGGFTFSGPLQIPRLRLSNHPLFFFSYELDKVLDSLLIDTLLPVEQNTRFPISPPTTLVARRLENAKDPALAAEIAPFVSPVSTPFTNTSILTRIDHQFSNSHNATVVFQLGRLTNQRQNSGNNRLADALQFKQRNSDAFSYSDNVVVSPKAVNQIRFQYSRLLPRFTAQASGPVVLITLNDSLPSDDKGRRTGTVVAGSSTSGGTDRREKKWQFQNIFSYASTSHSLKVGVDVHRVSSEFVDLSDASGTFNFASAGDFLANAPSRFRQSFQSTSLQKNTYTGLFVQDEWQILPQLLLSYGLRYERESIIHDANNFGPRLAVAYTPFSSGRFVVRAGGGIFYNRALLRTIDDFTLGAQKIVFDTNTLRDSTGKLLSNEQRRRFIAANLQFPDTLSADSALVREFGFVNRQFSRRLDRALRIPESYQLNVGASQDLGQDFSLEANLTFTRGIHLWREFNANAPRLPDGYSSLSEFLLSRDFPNFLISTSGGRLLYSASNAGELVRFVASSDPGSSVTRLVETNLPISLLNLNSVTSTTPVDVALAALNQLRPDPSQAEVEQLISAGNSFYRGLTLQLLKRFSGDNHSLSFRLAYTFSHLIDDGVVNTSDALRPADFRAERARSLLDRRHRLVMSGVVALPNWFGGLQLAPVVRLASGAPFNISLGGVDRNLDDVGNDRPNYYGDLRRLRWRAPGEELDKSILQQFGVTTIGESGNLPRNAGNGPGLFVFDLNLTREFRISERTRLRAGVEFDNVLNKTVFSFGSEFINFSALSPSATPEQRQAFEDSFLVATRTMRPRQIRLGLRLEF